MTATVHTSPSLLSRFVNGILAIKPIASFAKHRARTMMIQRAEAMGVSWTQEVASLKRRDWSGYLAQVENPHLQYPDYYVTSFHAYEEGNLGWEPALEVEVAAHAVHAKIWEEAGAYGDAKLRQSYNQALQASLPTAPTAIVDLGCSVGMSTFALQSLYPDAQITGVDLSPYFLAVAQYRTEQRAKGETSYLPTSFPATTHTPTWVHAAAEATGLPSASYELVSACLMFHELPRDPAIAIFHEARRLLRPGGHFSIMDMNPRSETFVKMPPFVLTLLKSTEPYLDQYFAIDFAQELMAAGFARPTIIFNSPRHRTIVAEAI